MLNMNLAMILLFAFPLTAVLGSPIIGGQGKFEYQYMPEKLKIPEGQNPWMTMAL